MIRGPVKEEVRLRTVTGRVQRDGQARLDLWMPVELKAKLAALAVERQQSLGSLVVEAVERMLVEGVDRGIRGPV